MKVSTRIFLCYLAISAVCLYYPFDWVLDTMRTRYLEGVEDPLVDQANVLAAVVETELAEEGLDARKWAEIFNNINSRRVNAGIYKLFKEQVDTRVYVTDSNGKVLFHSADPEAVGQNYSQWRDVNLTLKGEYGARTSRLNEDDQDSSVLYVAAPLIVDGRIEGVLTVGKPTTNITWFVKNAKLQVITIALLALLVAGLLGYLASRWITVPINRLTNYANGVREGKKTPLPKLGRNEIGEMGHAFEGMREALEGKRYVEQYIQNLTHEIKSPLSAIKGAAELLGEPMEDRQRQKFLANINNESRRIQQIVDRMLDLSSLESRNCLSEIEKLQVLSLVNTVVEGMQPVLMGKKINIQTAVPESLRVEGDPFLLHQALQNLVTNAVDFSSEKSLILVSAEKDGDMIRLSVSDQGTGIAEYAQERIFEKFFSLQRPDTGKKSTGLGLNFVRQVAMLHGGTIELKNRPEGGVIAVLSVRRKAVI